MDFHFFLFFGGQFRVFGDSVCVKKRTGGVCGGRYRISLSFSLFCIREKEKEKEKEEYVLVRKREKSQLRRNDWDSS